MQYKFVTPRHWCAAIGLAVAILMLGAIQAIEEAGKKTGKDVITVSIDGIRPAFEAMVAGDLNATVECNPLLGPRVFDMLQKLAHGEKAPKKVIIQDKMYTQDQAAAVIDSRKY